MLLLAVARNFVSANLHTEIRPTYEQIYTPKFMWIQDPMGIEYMNTRIAFIVICCRSTSPPGGNQVDGLPSAFIMLYCFFPNTKSIKGIAKQRFF